MTTLDLRRTGLNVETYPGDEKTLTFTFPANYLDGQTWTATAGETVCPVDLTNDTLTVTIPGAATEGESGGVALAIVDEAGSGFIGFVYPRLLGTDTPSTDDFTVMLGEAQITVTVVGTGPSGPSGGGGGGSGDVATDTIWNAAGDLAVGTGADTAARLAKGTEGTFLRAGATTAAWAALVDADIPATVARDSEVTSAVAAEASTRATDDAALDGRLDTLEAISIATDAELAAAVAAEATLARNADNLTSGTVADLRRASPRARATDGTAAVAAEAVLARNADNLTSGTVADARIAATIARDSEVTSAISTSEAGQVRDGDTAGGVLSGTYPSPGFAVDMATQAELNAKVTQTITNGVTTTAPSEDAVFDALALKETPAGAQAKADAKVTDAIADGVTTVAPSQNAVFDALALKAALAGATFTGTTPVSVDTVDWAVAITPQENAGGLVIKLAASTYDPIGATPYTTGEFAFAIVEEGSGDATDATSVGSVLMRAGRNGVGAAGYHAAPGFRTAYPAASAALWVQPYQTDVIPLVIQASSADGSGATALSVIANGQVSHSPGTTALPGITFVGDPDTGIQNPGADVIAFSTGGTQRATFSTASFGLADGINMAVGTGTGTKFGLSIAQKIGFHNATPSAQRSGAAQAAVATTAATNVTPYGFTTAAQADALVTLVNELRAAVVEKGLVKGSA